MKELPVYAFEADAEYDVTLGLIDDFADAYMEKHDNRQWGDDHFIGKSMKAKWMPPPVEVLSPKSRLRDFVWWSDAFTVAVSTRAKDALVGLKDVELLPLVKLRGIQYYAMNVVRVVDCLDMNRIKKENRLHPDGYIDGFYFLEDKIGDAAVFKVPQITTFTFVTEKFVEIVVRERLEGGFFKDPALRGLELVFSKRPSNHNLVKLPRKSKNRK